MAIVDINHYNLRGSWDALEGLRDWYRDTVGHLSEESPGENHPAPGEGTFDHVAFTCEDFDAMHSRLDSLGIQFRLADVPLTRTRQIFLRDPAGNGVELNFEMK